MGISVKKAICVFFEGVISFFENISDGFKLFILLMGEDSQGEITDSPALLYVCDEG